MKNKIAILVFLICSATLSPESKATVIFSSHYHRGTKGFAVTNTNDTLKGYFLVLNQKKVYYSSSEHGKRKEFRPGDFRSVYLELKSEKVLNTGGLMQYDYLKQYDALFRKIYSGKNVYYDQNRTYYAPERIFNVVIKDEAAGTFIQLPSDLKTTKKVLVDYLNQKYHTSFSYDNFDNSILVIREIDNHS